MTFPRSYTTAHIHLSSLRYNLISLSTLVAPAKLMVSVKANAYGHGIEHIVPECLKNNISHFCVSNVHEGVLLRKFLNTQNTNRFISILCFIPPFLSELSLAKDYSLDITVGSMNGLRNIIAYANSQRSLLSTHLKIDTGMSRLGINDRDAVSVATQIEEARYLNLKSVYTHFADSANNDVLTTNQLNIFLKTCAHLEAILERSIVKHAANTGGALFYPTSRLDFVRLGISIYGYTPHSKKKLPPAFSLKPVMHLTSKVVGLKQIKKGTSVSYSGTWVATRDTNLATVAIGYADGYPRIASSKGIIYIKGRPFRQVGLVTMDMIMVDIKDSTDIDIGEKVVIFGNLENADTLASLSETINYERLTSIPCGIVRKAVP